MKSEASTPKRAVRLIAAACLSAVIGAVMANFTEDPSERLATRLMQVVEYQSLNEHRLDAGGVPQIRYTRLKDGHFFYNPVYSGIYGLYYYDRWLEAGEFDYFTSQYHIYPPAVGSSDEWRQHFLAVADWFVANIQVHEHDGIRYGIYTYPFPWEGYRLEANWRSGMAQGLAMQVLARAWALTREDKYLQTGALARNAFLIDVADGGVTYKDAPDSWWYEEYAGPGAVQSRVLNGMEHALLSMHDYDAIVHDPVSADLFQKGLKNLEAAIPNYAVAGKKWTYYDRVGLVANRKYHRINVNLTRVLYAMTGAQQFAVWKEWDGYHTAFIKREFLDSRPHPVDWVILCLNWLLAGVLVLASAHLVRLLRRNNN